MIDRLSPARRNLALAAIGALVLWFAWSIRAVLNPLILGYLAAYIVHPMVLKLEARGRTRRSAVNLIFLLGALLTLLITLGFLAESVRLVRNVLSPPAVEQAVGEDGQPLPAPASRTIVERLDGAADSLEARSWWPEGWEIPSVAEVPALLQEYVIEDGDAAQAAGRVGLRAAGGVWASLKRVFGSAASVLGLILLVPLYTYFLLFELDRIHEFVRKYLPAGERERFGRVGLQIGEMLANFFRGRLLVCLLKGGLITVGLLLCGVDYAFLFGMGSGFLSLVPVVGPMIGWAAAFLVGTVEHDVVGSLWRTVLVFVVAENIEGYVLVPKILGDSLGLHPVVVIFAVLAGGAALGLFGMLIALPLTAAIVILFKELVLPALAKFAEDT